jgi:hypothetical protein
MRSGHLLLVPTTQQSALAGYFVPAVRLTPRQVLSFHRAQGVKSSHASRYSTPLRAMSVLDRAVYLASALLK